MQKYINKSLKINNQSYAFKSKSSIFSSKIDDTIDLSLRKQITPLAFLWLTENKEFESYFSVQENEFSNIIIKFQVQRHKIIEGVYNLLENKKINDKETKFYNFIEKMNIDELKQTSIIVKLLANHSIFHNYLDNFYTLFNQQFRSFYGNYFGTKYETILELINDCLPPITFENTSKVTFRYMFNLYINNKFDVWEDFVYIYNLKNFNYLTKNREQDKYISLFIKLKIHLEHTIIYAGFILELIENYPDLPLKDLCKQENWLKTYITRQNKNNHNVTIKLEPEKFIELDMNKKDINETDINLFMDFLVQMDNYFFCLLESLFMIVLSKTKK